MASRCFDDRRYGARACLSLRKRIEPDPSSPQFFTAEPWIGYRFIAEPIDL